MSSSCGSESGRSPPDLAPHIPPSLSADIDPVRGLQMTSPNTTWRIDYDPDSDNGFRLYNVYQRCYLASSFRLYPDWDGERGNDTVDAQIHQYVEATCTRFASEEASTLFLVEGRISLPQRQTSH